VFWALVWGTRSTYWIAASKAFHPAISTCNSRWESKPEFLLERNKSTTIPVYTILLPAVVDIGSAHKIREWAGAWGSAPEISFA